MPLKTKQETNRDYFAKKKNETHICPECKIPVKYQSRQAHLKTKKHLENCKKESSDFLEEYKTLHQMLEAPTANITDIFRQMYYLIQDEYFTEDGAEILTDEERWIQPKSETPQEAEFIDNTAYMMKQILKKSFDDKIRNLSTREAVDEWERIEQQFEAVKPENKDAKVSYLRYFRSLLQPPKVKKDDVKEEQSGGDDDEDDEDEEEEEEDKAMDMEEEEEEEEDNGAETYEVDASTNTSQFFPTIFGFRNLKKIKKEMVLEEIYMECRYVFSEEKFLIEQIVQALSERESLQYDILYEDLYACYKRWTYNERCIEENYNPLKIMSDDDVSCGSGSDNELNYDFKYEF